MRGRQVLLLAMMVGLIAGAVAALPLPAHGQTEPRVYVVIAVDTEADDDHPEGVYPPVISVASFQPGGQISHVMDAAFRNGHTDSLGHPFKMTWFVEMDNFVNQGQLAGGTPADYLTIYNQLLDHWGTEIAAHGDEIAYHHHFMHWNGEKWLWTTNLTGYESHNEALDAMILKAGFFPASFRSGWLWSSNQSQAWIEQWFPGDYSSAPGWESWERAPTSWVPYHPSSSDYQVPGNMAHWIARCDGEPLEGNINSAFAEAATGGGPVIYCYFTHNSVAMDNLVDDAHAMLGTASTTYTVPFVYATAQEALQAVAGYSDATAPTLTVEEGSGEGGNRVFIVRSDESVWNGRPYVAARYVAGDEEIYRHTVAEPTGTNEWEARLPATLTIRHPYDLTAEAEHQDPHHPAAHAIDGLPDTYWDSAYDAPVWIQVDLGESRQVDELTIHFWDEFSWQEYSYYVESSANGTDWATIVPPNTVHGAVTYRFEPAVLLRYARVTVTGWEGSDYARIREIALYGTDGAPPTTYSLRQVGVAAADTCGNPSVTNHEVSPTAVGLLSFTAEAGGRGIAVGWQTASESDNLGFYLHRRDAPGGSYALLNASLIPSQAPGSPLGAVYTWMDEQVKAGVTYYYRLEAVDVYGRSAFYGPVWAVADGPRTYIVYLPLISR